MANITVSNNQRFVAVNSEDAYVHVFDPDIGSMLPRLDKHEGPPGSSPSFPTRQSSLGEANNKALLWDMEGREVIKEMTRR